MLRIGRLYRLRFPGVAARVIEPPAESAPEHFPYLIESVFLKSRWYANRRGEPQYPDAPQIVLTSSKWLALRSSRLAPRKPVPQRR
jgi:hypothetical protein